MNTKCSNCASCGYPMNSLADFSGGDINSPYCIYCTNEQGELLPYETVLENNANYYQQSQGIDKEAARKMAADLMKTLPAWRQQ